MSVLGTGYLSSAANVLTSSPKILHVNKREFFRLSLLRSDPWIWYRWCNPDLANAWARLPCCLSKCSLERDFLDIYLTTFSESVISERQKLWGSSFSPKGSKFQADFKYAAKIWEQLFYLSDNCIWFGIVILSLLRTGYIPLVVNVLKNSPKIWHVNKRDFFILN